ncbi:Y-family DNA polymerase [Paraburkholderia sp. C35]|uniref:Y-family DNA polymerase n=1 Tax=Paraburkholderia sp. C35 TaxID=2126993 RepID=UPI0023B81614|nr:Y-family DNA polymerase [Paraburkholderia sp. C35]
MSAQVFALVDGNNMYVSCERVFRPDLIGKPVIVLSNNDGCAVARSQEAKDLNVKMGQPWFQIRHLAESHGLIALSSNYALYADMSSRMMAIAGSFAPQQEIYSIDETFLDFSNLAPAVPNLTVYGHTIRDRILAWIGIPTCVGIGPTKTLAKLSNHIAKKNVGGRNWGGVCDLTALPEPEVDALLAQIAVGEVWGVGRRLRDRLTADGINTALALKRADPTFIRSTVSVVLERTVRELNGVVCYPLECESQPQKQIVCSRSFGAPVMAFDDLAVALRDFAATAAGRMRKQNLKAGVMLVELQAEGVVQEDLFAPTSSKRDRLMAALDAVNDRFGRNTVRVGSIEGHQAWHMSQNAKTPSYTTDWGDLPVVR